MYYQGPNSARDYDEDLWLSVLGGGPFSLRWLELWNVYLKVYAPLGGANSDHAG